MYANNTPQWGPTKPLIVSDRSKLSYFARANMIRAGLNAGAAVGGEGAFAGLGSITPANRIDPVSAATGGPLPDASGSMVTTGGGGQSVSDFLDRLSRGVGAFFTTNQQPAPVPTYVPPDSGPLGLSMGAWLVGGVLALGVGYAILKK